MGISRFYPKKRNLAISLINNQREIPLKRLPVTVRSQVCPSSRLFAILNLFYARRFLLPQQMESSRCVETAEQQMRGTIAGDRP